MDIFYLYSFGHSIKDVWNYILNNRFYRKYSWQNGLSIIFENNDKVQ